IDFGLARVLEPLKSPDPLTVKGELLGTVAYMAPEQLRTARVDERADLWAVGVIAYEMLSGAHPFQAGSWRATWHRIMHLAPPALECVPADLACMVSRLMSKRPDERFQCAGELEDALRAIAIS